MRLEHLATERLTWLDLLAFVQHSPPDSALARTMDEEWWVTPELLRLRDIAHRLDVLIWHNTADGQKGRRAPHPDLITAAERDAHVPKKDKFDVMSRADALALIGLPAA